MILDIDFAKQVNYNCTSEKIIQDFNNNDEGGLTLYSPLQEFYNDQTIFITGGTGFLGKILIEKLLRSCPDVSRIYVLIRQKKGKNVDERIKDLLKDTVFDNIRDRLPKLGKKVIGIPGDCSLQGLGLYTSDTDLLIDEVSIVFHVAATVRFDEKLKQATAINMQSTGSIIDLCKNMHKLKSFIHVSTAYANCFSPNIEEKFYDYAIKYDELINLLNSLPEDTIDEITPQLINSWPNTYTFTKALAEDLIRTKNKNLPMGIFRPGIVLSAANEPMPGWTDNYNGPTGVVAGAASGIMRTMHCDPTKIGNIVPVDLTVNALIASAWDVATQKERRDEDMLIYNYTSTVEAPISWGTFRRNTEENINKYPTDVALWYFVMRMTKSKFMYSLYVLFLHWIPALLVDTASRCTGQKPRLQNIYRKLHKLANVTAHFCTREWDFKNDNVQRLWSRLDARDKQIFQFTMKNFDWSAFFANYIKGVRIYLLKDNLDSLEVSRIKWNRYYWANLLLQGSLLCLGYWLMWSIYSVVFY